MQKRLENKIQFVMAIDVARQNSDDNTVILFSKKKGDGMEIIGTRIIKPGLTKKKFDEKLQKIYDEFKNHCGLEKGLNLNVISDLPVNINL